MTDTTEAATVDQPDKPPMPAYTPPPPPKFYRNGSDFAPKPPPKPRMVTIDRVEHKRQIWFARMPDGSDIEDALTEIFWAPVVNRLARHDVLHLLAADESWEAEGRVEGVYASGAEISIVKKFSRKPVSRKPTILEDGRYVTRFEHGVWSVIRVADGHPVVRGCPSETAALIEWERYQPRKVR